MTESRFVYVTYIRSTPEKIWEALTTPEFQKKYWFGSYQESEWKPGASWKLLMPEARVADAGEVVEAEPPRRIVLKWRNEFVPELKEAGFTSCTFEIEPEGELTKLTVVHEAPAPHPLIERVAAGWPKILSSLKTLLETGQGMPRTDQWPKR